MTQMTIYDPPQCCPTGACGPKVDPQVSQLAGDLDWLKGQGVEVARYNLSQQPSAFVESSELQKILDEEGEGGLPAFYVDGVLKGHGYYPERSTLAAWAGVNQQTSEGA